MKSIIKIFSRYVATAAAIALLLLVINLAIFLGWIIQSKQNAPILYSMASFSERLVKTDGLYFINPPDHPEQGSIFEWAMLLSPAGDVIWSEKLPPEIPLHYTVAEVASFTRWYLMDYPVHVWGRPDGLLVLGRPKGSSWKHDIEMPVSMIDQLPAWLGLGLLLNVVAALLLALLLGFRLFLSLRKLSKGIEAIAERKPVELSTSGLLGDLAEKLYQTSIRLKEQEAALHKRDNARTTWIAGVSHDIRTPLSMVMGYASQLENAPHLDENDRQKAGIIRRQSEKIKTLVNDLNLASKLEYNMQPLRTTLIDPAELARSVLADLINNGLPEIYSIDLLVAPDSQRPLVQGDEYLLRRAVHNLVENSIRHNPEGCAITLRLENEAGYCRLTISDNGVGFPPEVIQSLEHPVDPEVIQNHGLGLTIVQQIVKSHHGVIEFHSQPGLNCQVILRLPLYE